MTREELAKGRQRDFSNLLCKDCERPHAMYMVKKEVWLLIALPELSQGVARHMLLCIECAAKRLGRDFTIDDFSSAPVNDSIRYAYRMGKRFQAKALIEAYAAEQEQMVNRSIEDELKKRITAREEGSTTGYGETHSLRNYLGCAVIPAIRDLELIEGADALEPGWRQELEELRRLRDRALEVYGITL